jgi:polar amino acid transport system substrate-binding protein/cystine transport system substrate-binding protein/membrane-bound lytic murein transglycosylase F
VIPPRWRRPLSYLLIFAPLAAVYLLPPDTSLAEVKRAGVLRVCVPYLYPPLVTDVAAMPGLDIELLQRIAMKLGVGLDLSRNEAMGRDFNPRSWHVTRAQCEVLAGGIVASPLTKSFLETSPPYEETGWAFILPKPLASIEGRRAGVLAGVSGLDRIALARYLREQKVELTIAPGATEFTGGLRDGRFEFGAAERLFATALAAQQGYGVEWAPAVLPRYPVALGLWKGDLTLKRAIVDVLGQLERDGEVAAIIARYLGSSRT